MVVGCVSGKCSLTGVGSLPGASSLTGVASFPGGPAAAADAVPLAGGALCSSSSMTLGPAAAAASSCSILRRFQRLPFGAGSSGVRQYVTVRVTTCRTLILPGWLLRSGWGSFDSNEALQGVELRGVET